MELQEFLLNREGTLDLDVEYRHNKGWRVLEKGDKKMGYKIHQKHNRFVKIVAIMGIVLMLTGMLPAKPILAAGFDQNAYYLEIGQKLDYWANKYNIPPVVLKAVAWMESGWYQNRKDIDGSPLVGQPLMGYDGIGIGIMQVSSYNPDDTEEVDKLKNDVDYNIEVGCQLLNQKWRAYPKIGNGDRNILENWYFAVWGFNSWQGRNNPNDPLSQGKSVYQNVVFALMGQKYNSAITFAPGATPQPKSSLPATGAPAISSLWSTPSPTHSGDLKYDVASLVTNGGRNYGGPYSDASGDYWYIFSRWSSYYALGFYTTAYNNPAITTTDKTMLEDKILKAEKNLLAEADSLANKAAPSANDLATAAKYYWTILQSPNLDQNVMARAQAGLTKAQTTQPTPTDPTPIPPAKATVNRIAGLRAVDTAIELSRAGWTKADTVVIATTANYPDALAGAPLAKKFNAPMLLNPPGTLDSEVLKELSRLEAKKVYILGGTAAISKSVFDGLVTENRNPERIGGTTAAETAAQIARTLGANQTVILASTLNFPDAMAASAPAAALGIPILLTGRDALPEATQNVLSDFKVTKTIIVGGDALISPKFDDTQKGPLAQYGPVRLKGLTKYDTALAIVKYFNQDPQKVYIATGVNFPDGLAGGALAAKTGSPLILMDTFVITPEVLNWLASIKGKNPQVSILGGTGAISEANRLLIEKTVLP